MRPHNATINYVAVMTTTVRATKRVTRVAKAAASSKNNIANLRHGRVPLQVAVWWAAQTLGDCGEDQGRHTCRGS